MLQLITGRSGSGKTTEVYRELKQRAAEQAALFLLVPEQASFDSERRLLAELGPVLSQRVRVLSFTRLADVVFREVGGLAGKRMDATLSLLLMSQALHSVADSLTLYRRHVDNAEYLRAVAELITECKQCAVSPEQLEETAAALPDGLLRRKLTELALIFGAYEALVAQAALIDPQDDLTVLAKRLPESRAFDGAHVYVDGFTGFTGQEHLVLERLITRAATVTVTLCTDDISERAGQVPGRFFAAARTATWLREAAYKAHVPVAAVRRLTDNLRTTEPALRTLEAGCFAPQGEPFNEPTDAVCVTPCANREEECRYAARLIRRLLREEGGHCRDFTVVARNLEEYADALDAALRREGLPCCRDYREPVLTQPLITLIESALAAVTNGWDSGDMLRLTKTGLIGFATSSASLLENYVFLWNVRGRAWLAPFTAHPDGLTAAADDKAAKRLDYLNVLRHRLVRPLEQLAQRLADHPTGADFAEAVWQLLQAWRVPRLVRLQVARLDAAGEHALADYEARLWEYVVALLDKFAAALGDTRLSAARLAELFHLAASTDDLGSIPQGLDGVTVGAASRIRYVRPQTVIVLGANEGVFPAFPTASSMLTDHERRQLTALGLPMKEESAQRAAEEQFYAYAAVAAPAKRLVVTYARQTGDEAAHPSALVEAIDRLVPGHAVGTADDPNTVLSESETDAFACLAARFRDNTAAAAAYREVFDSLPAYAPRLAAMRRAEEPFAFRESAAARQLFGEHLRLSPSQVETFHRCRFAYFCQYGLRAKPRRAAELNAAEAGTLVHYVMKELLPRYGGDTLRTLTRPTVEADVTQVVRRYVDTCMGGTEGKEARFMALVAHLERLCSHLLWRVVRELQNSRFVPVDFELPIGRYDEDGNGIPPWILTLPDGTTVQVHGVVDRVDTYEENGRRYLRILDYKTGNKTFDLAEVVDGLNLQMLIYLFSICENGQARYGDVVPSGVLYLPAKIPVIRVERDLPPEEMEKRRLATMKMNGLLLDDPEILKAMEPELEGVFIPAAMGTRGQWKKGASLASLEQFGHLKQHIQRLLTAMAEHLHAGDIAALPAVGATDGCEYCEYHDVCGHERGDPIREIAALSREEALAALQPEDENEEVNPHE